MYVKITVGSNGLNWSPIKVRAIIPSKFYESDVALYITVFLQNLLYGAAVVLPCVEPSEPLRSGEGGAQWIGGEGVLHFE